LHQREFCRMNPTEFLDLAGCAWYPTDARNSACRCSPWPRAPSRGSLGRRGNQDFAGLTLDRRLGSILNNVAGFRDMPEAVGWAE
jgi:hypothetical protein